MQLKSLRVIDDASLTYDFNTPEPRPNEDIQCNTVLSRIVVIVRHPSLKPRPSRFED